ncbi:LysR family transcriptional regulator [Sphingomonas prati]|uniref:DNA-binding transcriptional LysR family regulator n=1 Tax=Sphingomonas prati TaxID=1843237 RepID=A0A7W9F1B4_9SPHN|nr:LysR family transcriptional regulator [Sphingomonas prati]MBB5729076.1 DNA-binding transcriptional LysR family regulator [Sphingomonas prati]
MARARSFRAAADQLGVTRSAVSQAVRKVEDALGTAVLRRTTRSVALTEAGEALLEQVAPALAEIDAATQIAAAQQGRPTGLLRLAVSSIAESFLSGDLLASFLSSHPGIRLDVLVTDAEFDIVAAGFDAGVRLGEVIERDMIAIPVSGEQHQIVVAAPAYLTAAGTPLHPRELTQHRCIGWRSAVEAAPYRWEFTEKGRDFAVAVEPEITSNDMALMVRMARAGAGLTIGMAETFAPLLQTGELCAILEPYCPPLPGFYLFYPSRRHLPMKLRALVDHVRERRNGCS